MKKLLFKKTISSLVKTLSSKMFNALFILFPAKKTRVEQTRRITYDWKDAILELPRKSYLETPPSPRVFTDEETLARSHTNGYSLFFLTYSFWNYHGLLFQLFSVIIMRNSYLTCLLVKLRNNSRYQTYDGLKKDNWNLENCLFMFIKFSY